MVFLPEGRVNTLMAGAGLGHAARGRYTAAGYVYDEESRSERELYIERDQAGSARDLMRDNNRVGYAGEDLDEDGLPFSFFMEEPHKDRKREERETARRNEKKKTPPFGRVVRARRRERRAFAACCALAMLNLTLLAFWGQTAIDGVRKRDTIEMYERGAQEYRMEIDAAQMKIADAQNGERVRNKAQNELGMLRNERVTTQKIYIQTSNLARTNAGETLAQEDAGLLDWLLSVADIFDFRS